MRATALSLVIIAGAAALEGLLAGRGIRARFGELRLPRFSPPLAAWVVIGIGYYVVCYVILRRLLTAGLTSSLETVAFSLLILLMLANAGWGLLFFRRKDVRASFLAFFPYGLLALGLTAVLMRLDQVAALPLVPYLIYLIYATWWAYRLWRLNAVYANRRGR
jgi:tryptophan-rich sensory protein